VHVLSLLPFWEIKQMIRAFIFDFDGLIVDTEYPRYMGWKHIYEMVGCNLTPDDYAQCVGRRDGHFDFRSDLDSKAKTPIDWIKADQIRQELRLSLLAQEQELPGVRSLIEESLRIGLKIGIASSSPREWVHGQLRRISMLDLFYSIVTADDVLQPKPNPACYRKALEDLEVPADEAVAFEDSPVGCHAALNAGLGTVVVTNRITRSLEFPSNILRLESLAGMRAADIVTHFI
jgi:HAD superfamily hydrolase (TIGR01509 family)